MWLRLIFVSHSSIPKCSYSTKHRISTYLVIIETMPRHLIHKTVVRKLKAIRFGNIIPTIYDKTKA